MHCMAERMPVSKVEEMNRLLQEASQILQQAVDVGVMARDEGAESRKAVDREWERFIGGLWAYLRQKGRERGENLIAGVSLTRVMMGGK